MPGFIYRKSMNRTPTYAKAEIGTGAKSSILKYGDSTSFLANFAIRHLNEVLRDCIHTRHASVANCQLSMPCIPIFCFQKISFYREIFF